jgi:NitT/TauT family transport system substrate-binding protein
LALVLIVALTLVLSGCANQGNNVATDGNGEKTSVNVRSLKGPTSIGLLDFMQKANNKEADFQGSYNFQIVGTADEILPGLINGSVDIALIPANAAAVLYNKTGGGVQVFDINTYGVLYVVSADSSIKTLADLSGKTVLMTGKGTTPEYVTNYLLGKAGLSKKVKLEYKSEATELAAAIAADPKAIAILPEPYVSSVNAKNSDLQARISLTEVWNKETGGDNLVTGVTVVRKDFAAQNPQIVQEFLANQQASAAVVSGDPTSAANLVVQYGIIADTAVAAKAIPNCNIVCDSTAQYVSDLKGYLDVLFKADPASVGGTLPADDFYLILTS